MNDSKSKCFSPALSEANVRAEGLPRAIGVTRSGTRALGGQWVLWISVVVSPRTLPKKLSRILRSPGATRAGRARQERSAIAEGVAEGVPQGVAQDLGFGARAARALIATPPPPPPPSLCSVRLLVQRR